MNAADLDDDAYRTIIGRRIRILRVAAGLSQQDLADAAGVTRNFISAIERHTQSLDVIRVRALRRPLGVTLADLLSDLPQLGLLLDDLHVDEHAAR